MRALLVVARRLRKSPAFTLVAVASLALAIGANTLIFGIVNALLFKPLPVVAPDRLVRLGSTHERQGFGTFSYREFLALRGTVRGFDGLTAHQFNSVTFTVGSEPRTEWMELVAANYFDLLGVRVAGRAFLPAEDSVPGGAPVVVISDALWRSHFGADPATVGRTVKVNGHPFTVVGVAPPGFRGTFAGFGIDLWVPLMMQAIALPNSGSLDRPTDRFLMLLGRLGRSMTPAGAQAELSVLARGLASTDSTYRGYGIRVAPASGVHPFIAGVIRAFLALLQGIVTLVLLIACANLANLLLARAAGRRRELAVRAAIGAGRWRLMQHLLAESFLVALLGGGAGLLLAGWASRVVTKIQLPVGIPLNLDFRLDARVALFGLGLTFLTALCAGLLPAWRASRPDVLGDLRVAGATPGRTRSRLRHGLVAIQIAIASLLLVNTDLLLQSIRNSRTVDPGFDPTNLTVLQAEPAQLGYDSTRIWILWGDLRERALRIPGVERAALALFVPLGNRGDDLEVGPAGATGPLTPRPYNTVTPGYFETLRIPFRSGRDFTTADAPGAVDVAIVSESAARRYFGTRQPVGQALRVRDHGGRERRVEIVGVVGDVKWRSLAESDQSLIYMPAAQWLRDDLVLHLRVAPGAGPVARPLRETVRLAQPDLAVTIQSMAEATSFTLIPLRIAGRVLGFAGLIGLLLAVIGVFGVAAYAMTQRTREVGIRIALGATGRRILRMVMLQGARPALVGLVFGTAAALAASRLLSGLLVGVSPLNLEGLLLVPVFLAAVSLFAAWLPARRVSQVDPVTVLKEE